MLQAAYDWLLRLVPTGRGPILIYQMGRVGSTTLEQAILAAKPGVPVYHVHHLSHGEVARLRRVARKTEARTGKVNSEIWSQFDMAEEIHKLIAEPGCHPKIVTLVRDPIARTLSDRIRNAVHFYPHVLDDNGEIQPKMVREELISTFEADPKADEISSWFEAEMKASFGFDVYTHAFDHLRGYLIVRKWKQTYLILRMEDLDRVGPRALKEMRIPAAPFVRHEVTPDSRKVVFSLPRAVCEGVYSGRLARHFYSEAERQAFIQKWSDSD